MRLETLGQLADTLKGIVRVADGEVTILTLPPIRNGLIDLLADAALQGARPELRATARWLIKKLAPQMGVMLREGSPGHADHFGRVAISCSTTAAYPFLRNRFRHFLEGRENGFEAVDGDGSLAGARSGIDAVAVAAAIQEGFRGDLYNPVFLEGTWRLFAVRSETGKNVPTAGKTLWEELLSAQAEETSEVIVHTRADVAPPASDYPQR